LIVSPNYSDDTHIAAALASDGSMLLAYVPPTGPTPTTLAVDLRALSGPARARWWNPTTGTYVPIGGNGTVLPNDRAAQEFTTPGDNGTGTNDWMLVLAVRGTAR
ncbi:MAG TPA: putative collagen-binding domain-containing protein, partial [Opitutus sp.]|nr:putative collagen-binding domain-containing protein [Opitutus sp.]